MQDDFLYFCSLKHKSNQLPCINKLFWHKYAGLRRRASEIQDCLASQFDCAEEHVLRRSVVHLTFMVITRIRLFPT